MSSPAVLFFGNDPAPSLFYQTGMNDARPGWHLKEWLEALNLTQQWVADELGIQKSKVSRKATGVTAYDRDDVLAIARLLEVEPYELLITPDEAMAIRSFRESAVRIAAEARLPFRGASGESEGGRLAPPAKPGTRRPRRKSDVN